jgi:hypothetical protein
MAPETTRNIRSGSTYVVEGAISLTTRRGYRAKVRVLSYDRTSDRLLREGDQE